MTNALATHLANAKLNPAISHGPFEKLYLPFYMVKTRTSTLASAWVTRVTETKGGSVSEHTVVIAYGDGEDGLQHYIWCADGFLDKGKVDVSELRERTSQASSAVPAANRKLFDKKLQANMHRFEMSSDCPFWRNLRRDKSLCDHTYHALAALSQAVPDFAEQLVTYYNEAIEGAPTKVASGDTLSLGELVFRTPVLIEGDRGSGKTTEVREYARANNVAYVEMGGHEGIEAPDLLGYLVPYGDRQMVWKDGPLSEAFRKAQKGKTLLLLDELLRIPTRELSILLTSLSPDNGVFRLRTGRVLAVEDGVAQEETLECPVENLAVVATTNVGMEYAVDEIDAAVAERFVPLRKDTELETVKGILVNLAKSLKLPVSAANSTVKFFKVMRDAQSRGDLPRGPTTRTLTRALTLADGDVNGVKRALKTQTLLWVARTSEGSPVPEQVQMVHELLDACFKGS